MPDPARLRDSTEILLPAEAMEGIREELERRFTLTFFKEECGIRIIGSPVEIKGASDFLARNGVAVH
ncbi:hypothetical protein BRC64_04595 [Halobacteriales archaeon QH_10_67_22]|jgi:hypothetical protein|nr:MAG: hypothetical protein BRC64_04595 [Halobacteriales archaeon QH_10_67_22]